VPARDVERVAPSTPSSDRPTNATASVEQQGDTGARRATPKPRLLTDDEQRVADGIAFAPSPIERFFVAARNKRLLVDVGRVDLETKQDARQLALVRRVAARVGPLSRVTHVRVRGRWGEEVDSIAGYDVWNGRVVAVLAPSATADSLLKKGATLVAVATRVPMPVDSSAAPQVAPPPPAAPATVACVRDSVPPELPARAAAVRDSVVRWVTDSLKPSYATSGKLAWRRGTGSYVYASAAVAQVPNGQPTVYFGSYDGTFYALDARTGGTRWSYRDGGKISGGTSVIGGIVYYSNWGKRDTTALGAVTGRKIWTNPRGAFNPVVSDGEDIYLTGFSSVARFEPLTVAQEHARAKRIAKQKALAKKRAIAKKKKQAAAKKKKQQAAKKKAAKKKQQKKQNGG